MKTIDQIKTVPDAVSRRGLNTRTSVASAAPRQRTAQASDKQAIRPFQMNVPEAELTELRRRINATRWPERETVQDASQGVQLATTQALARYWATEYDWRRCEAQLNALPQFRLTRTISDSSLLFTRLIGKIPRLPPATILS